jgi:uracil-DNA glycosylase
MKEPAELLARYLRQRAELGESEVILGRQARVLLGAAVGSATPGAVVPPAAVATPVDPEPTPSGADVHMPRAAVADRLLILPDSLDALAAVASGCTVCGLCRTRTTVVFGEGNPAARLVVVGEAPGAEEDRTGRPFVGRAGRLLEMLLGSVGFPRESVYICNVLKCRPPGNRNPQPDEVAACSPYLRRQIELIGPRAILAVGTFPAQTLLATTSSIGQLRGAVHEYEGIPLVPTYHPAALLRNSAWVRPVWEDLQRLRATLDR